MLAASRKSLSLLELGQIFAVPQRRTFAEAIQPVRAFLRHAEGGIFYHERFDQFVTRDLLYADELRDAHVRLAAWLLGRDTRNARLPLAITSRTTCSKRAIVQECR